MDAIYFIFMACLAAVAFCYAAVGHGGASGYIAVYTLFGMVAPSMKWFVLLMNLLVAAVAFYQYYKQGYFSMKYFWPWGLGASPMAYLGAGFEIDARVYRYFLAFFLLFSVAYLLGIFDRYLKHYRVTYREWKALLIAMLLGLVSGITGVGGGIFLSPILLLFSWQDVKQTAAISALFIVVNSLAGLIAMQQSALLVSYDIFVKLFVVIMFGFAGSWWGAKIENQFVLKRMLAFVLLIAAVKLCIT